MWEVLNCQSLKKLSSLLFSNLWLKDLFCDFKIICILDTLPKNVDGIFLSLIQWLHLSNENVTKIKIKFISKTFFLIFSEYIYIYRHISKGIPLHNFFYICNLGCLYLTDMCNMIHAHRELSKEVRTFYKIEISAIEKKLSDFKCFF